MSQQINLFNPIFLKQKKTFSAANMVDAMALLLVGVGAFYAYASLETLNLDRQAVETGRQYEQSKAQLAEAGKRYAPKKIDASLEAVVNQLQAQLHARKATLDSVGTGLLAEDISYAEYMRALARQSLPGLWLTGFRLGKGGAEMEITGRALQPELVPSYIHRLGQERALHGRAFDSLRMTQQDAAMPAGVSAPAAVPATYRYIEFRLGSSYSARPADRKPGLSDTAAQKKPGERLREEQRLAPGGGGGLR